MAHQRSVSLHTIRDDRSGPDPITVAATAPERSSGAASSSIKSHNLRRRSTGSLDEFEGASPSNIETLIESDEKLGHGTAPAELSNNPRPSRKKEQENLDLQHYNKWKKDPQSLKSVILDAIRDKSVSKYARLRTVRRHLANIWKALTNTTAKLPRTPIIEEDGYIYIYKSKNAFPGPKYVKIGKTRQAPNERIYKWETSCKFECIPIKDNNDKRFLHYHAVERIVHAELYNERRKYKCNECNQAHKLGFGAKYAKSPSTEHGEWFEISEEKALQVVNKWRDWVIKSDPYRPDGRIRARWLWKCTLGSFWMNGTEEDWIVWRDLNSLEIFRCVSNHFKKWLDVVLPPTVELLMARGAIFGLAPVWYFWAWGFNFGTCVVFLTAVLTLVYLCLTFC
ncbi:hypothetical protein N431DRAFT_351113 [Stipitochalara longipes BDJ]|nr:hypothetical protein N431DRAFT_351113 [Stipitochalara longipes BDJ]